MFFLHSNTKKFFYKLFRGALVFVLIFGWVFSGWLQVFDFLPKTHVAQAATVDDLLKQIEALSEQVLQLQNRIKDAQPKTVTETTTTPPSSTPSFYFDSNLSVGSSGAVVTKLQKALTGEGVYRGPVTGYFGPLTKAGVIAFQDKYGSDILAPLGFSEGTGYFGASTRKKLNALLSGALTTKQNQTVVVQTKQTKQYPLVTTSTAPSGGRALLFDGINDYVDFGSDASLDLGSDFKISLSINTTDRNGGIIVGKIDEGGVYEQFWYVQVLTDGSGRIEASLGDGTSFSQLLSSVSVADGKWHRITFKRSGDSQTLLVDGISKTDINYIDSGIKNVNPKTNIVIGGDTESNDYYFDGLIDDVSIIIEGVERGTWDFEEDTGSTALDSSGNGNNGVIIGAIRTSI